ncbi:PBP1A family penicillin-binding protein [Clostridium algidicarnis]|uniref:transglycosylase domain-containing protein n=1 Tax=Clostridium algidicarnis TaxID=37659 RepID=UPI001C0D20E8|nr:PBP1A family penicillin-binding protein [Clostridium algidicarnis]MBU3205668.1 PBP1A family penicillin-binding protein [Clostridium algidicarnis]
MVQHKNKTKKDKKSKHILRNILLTFLFICLFSGATLLGIGYSMIKSAPELNINELLLLNEVSVMYDNKESYMDNVPTDEKRTVITIDKMPIDLQNAFISIEDERFRQHHGIDVKRVFGAVYIDVKNKITGKPGLHGASTITQQLLKNTLLTPKVSVKRKVQEMYLAIELEKKLNKDQILEAYLNTIFLGGKANGVEEASNQYFNKPAIELNLIESAYLAGMNQSPSVYYPFSPSSQKDPSKYLNRTKIVLQKMLEMGSIDEERYNTAIEDLDNGSLVFEKPNYEEKLNYEWFSWEVLKRVKSDLKRQYNYTDKEVSRLVTYGGLKIYTTMDKDLQDYSQDIINDTSKYINIQEYTIKSGDIDVVQPQVGAAIMDYRSGEVKTIIGGRGDLPPTSYNRGASLGFLKPTGSAIKPLTVYAPAIDMKLANASSLINDTPLTDEEFKRFGFSNGDVVKNVDGQFRGPITLRTALTYSVNIAALKLEDNIGKSNGVEYGKKFGLIFNKRSQESLSAISLGEFDNDPKDKDGSNPLYMAAAYGTFGNNGIYTEPILYTKVTDRTGKVILERTPDKRKVISPEASYILYDMLKGPVINYSGRNAKFSDMPVAGKTGTSEGNKNLWFAGLTPYYSAAVWIGSDTPKEIKTIGNGETASGNTAGILWRKLMEKVHEGLEVKDINIPEGLKMSKVCLDSGKLATELCSKDPRGNHRIIEDYFIEGTIPNSLCDAHVEVKINRLNGKRATENTPKDLIETRVFISKAYAGSVTDAYMVEPTELDDYKPTPEPDKIIKDEKVIPPVPDKPGSGNVNIPPIELPVTPPQTKPNNN